jgi:hypothetical protein
MENTNMTLFAKLTTDNMEESKDVVGSNFDPVSSGLYDATIKVAYAGKSRSSDSQSVTLVLDLNGREYRETVYVTSGTGENYYVSKEDKKTRYPLPSFTMVDDICLLTTGESLSEQASETKVVKIYNYDEKKEVPTEVPVLMGLTGKQVTLGILRNIVDKSKKNDSGAYVATGETRIENTIDKVFHSETGRTVNEYRHEVMEPEFRDAWETRNKGKDRNRAKGAASSNGASSSGSSGTGSPKKKLFG